MIFNVITNLQQSKMNLYLALGCALVAGVEDSALFPITTGLNPTLNTGGQCYKLFTAIFYSFSY